MSQLTPKLNKAYEEYEQAIQEAPFPNESDRSQKLARLNKLKEERKAYADVRQRATTLLDAGDHEAAITLALTEQSDVYKRMSDILEEDKADSVRLARAEMAHSEDVFSGVKATTLIALIIPLFQTGKDTHVNHSPYRIKDPLYRPLIFSSIRIRSSMPIAIFSDRSLGRFLFSVRISFACAGT